MAPLVATTLAGATVGGADGIENAWIGNLVAFAAMMALVVDSSRRQRVKPRPTVTFLVRTAAGLAVFYVVMVAWAMTRNVTEPDRFFPGLTVIGWLATTAFFGAVIALLNRRRAA